MLGSKHRQSTTPDDPLRLTLRLKQIAHLFVAPALSPFDPYFSAQSMGAGIDYLIGELQRAPRVNRAELTILLPREELAAADLAQRTRAAIRRYADAATSLAHQSHDIELRKARTVGGFAVAFFVVANLLSLQYAHAGSLFGESGVWLDVLMDGLSVGAWVALWWPLDQLYQVWQQRLDERVYLVLREIDLRILPDPAADGDSNLGTSGDGRAGA